MEFVPFQKIGRLSRGMTVTEKIDGTNAQVCISSEPFTGSPVEGVIARSACGQFAMRAGSRTRWTTPGKETDNFGFAAWCRDNAEELFGLGEGRHFGEWWGSGIQSGYGLAERRFSLFNVTRWGQERPPQCCGVVPILYEGPFCLDTVAGCLLVLGALGSTAAPGFREPEGVVVYHHATKTLFKKLLANDDMPKGAA